MNYITGGYSTTHIIETDASKEVVNRFIEVI